MVSQEEIKELKSQQTNFDSTVRKLHIKKAELQQQVKTLSERGQEFATTKYQKTECPRQQLEKIVTELQSTVETLQDEKKGLVEILRKMSVLEERRDHLEQVVVNQQAVIANDRQVKCLFALRRMDINIHTCIIKKFFFGESVSVCVLILWA